MIRKTLVSLLLGTIQMSASADVFADDPRGIANEADVVVLRTSKLECSIINNKSLGVGDDKHHPGYNGVFKLKSVDQRENPFVSAYAGLNLEHYFDSRQQTDGSVFFEPRYSAMTVKPFGRNGAELHQPATETYGVESWTEFHVREPYYIDFVFTCRSRRDDLKGGFLGVFWASYINGPLDKSFYFLDAESTLDKPLWRQLCTQQHNRDSTVRSADDQLQLQFEARGSTLFSSLSPLRYSEPFFYGRFRNMVLIYVFEPNPHLRFTQSPSGGGPSETGDDTNPAWDFQLIIPNVELGKQYSLLGRLIYKPWEGRMDVLEEVKRYQALTKLRRRPSAIQLRNSDR